MISLVFLVLFALINRNAASIDYQDFYEDIESIPPRNQSVLSTLTESSDFEEILSEEYDQNDYIDDDYVGQVSEYEGLALSGAVELLPRDTALILAQELDVRKETALALSRFANAHPYAIFKFSLEQLDVVLKRSKVIHMLANKTIDYLIHNQELVDKMAMLPQTTLAAMISSNPRILARYPPYEEEFAAKNLTMKLLQDVYFLKRIPLQIHVYLAETNFRHFLTPNSVAKILNAYPEITNHLGSHGLALIPVLIQTPLFVSSLSCKSIIVVANNTALVNSLNANVFSVLARNNRVWECMPLSLIRNLTRDAKIGGKVGFGDLFATARLLTKNKSLDNQVLSNLYNYQVSDFARFNFIPSFYRG